MQITKKWLLVTALSIVTASRIFASDTTNVRHPQSVKPDADNGGIITAKGFGALMVADHLGRVRHIAVNSNGDIYVKLQRLRNGAGVVRLRDTNGDGKADDSLKFANYSGTGIAIKNGYLYSSSDEEVFRYKLNDKNEIIDPAHPEKIITGLKKGNEHETKSITLDNNGNIYVNVGAPSNACQIEDRTPGSPALDPCPLLDSAGGIWQFRADKLNQTYAQGVRYGTGIRNTVGLDWNTDNNELYVMQHGRDQLATLFPNLYNNEQSAELPAEEMLLVKKGMNFGWPYCYYDELQKKKVLAPEYGGDGKKEDRCAMMQKPVMAFPGHWAPNALLFYTGNQFPERYKNGAFIAFHGSWNRAPLKQGGYFIAFVPFKNGLPSGDYEVFAEGFAGKEIYNPRDAKHRPCGLAQGPDGSLYITDDVGGSVWRVVYTGK